MSFPDEYLPQIVYSILSVLTLYFAFRLGISPKSILGAGEAEGVEKPKKDEHKKEEE